MADEGDVLTDLNLDPAAGANGADTRPTAGFISQYIKDMSVENPNAPAVYQWNEQPAVDLQFNIGANAVNEEVSEVELKINVEAKTDSGALYLIELVYAGLVGIRNMPEDQAHMFIYAEAPRILFPFARRVIADATRDLGFQPLMLDPIDFNGLYMQRLQQKAAEEAAAQGGDAPAGDA
ncbi:protein-export chaperone SecB [Parerythrobacter aestuarii]|uniref:protein-export chaperone SecB n=1 Tax=Parerythrobacter aestuarii TaxID=3020909 RepID=UPI0024DE0794|nr:protein-export chaperone SecB [Parerythrobacter aestuarii]